MTSENTLNGGKQATEGGGFSLQDLMDALADTSEGERPVERWNPDYCGDPGASA